MEPAFWANSRSAARFLNGRAAPPKRLALVALSALALLSGLWAGLVRIGWPFPTLEPDLVTLHGPLMLGGFLGLVIGLERAVALGRSWAYASPALAGVSSVALLAGLPSAVGATCLLASSLLLIVIFQRLYRIRPEAATLLMLAGAGAWAIGNALWLAGWPLTSVVPWWVGFLVLTIIGERQELAQVLLASRTRSLLVGCVCVVVAGLALSTASLTGGIQLAGLGLIGLAAWLLTYDVARRSLRRGGLARFSGVALLVGYVWLGLAGAIWLLGPERAFGGFWYDAMLHTVFLGFAFSMIFGHAPTIVPAISGLAVPFQRHFYVHLVLLHASLVLRVIGDVAAQPDLRRWGGMLNATAILLFIAVTFAAARTGATSARPR